MDLILKSSAADFLLVDVGVIIKTGAGSNFSDSAGVDATLRKALGQSRVLRGMVSAATVVVNDGSSDLGITAGLQYLNRNWFQAGADTNVSFSQIENSISDTQHGSRGGGSLHAAAVAGVSDGFLTAADKTKLDGAAVLTSTAPVNVTKAAAAVGVGTDAARNDHKHDITTGTPVAVGTANAEGAATSLARSDHVHDGPPFGKSFAQASQEAEATYTGTTNYQVRTTLNTGAIPAGTYRVGFHAEIRCSTSIADDIKYRVQRDATTVLAEGNIEVKDQTNYFPVSGFIHVALAAGTYSFTLEYGVENAADTVAIRRARLEFWRIS
jgi:hypothetical protein